MRDRGIIYTALGGFIILITLPFSYSVLGGKSREGPKLTLPAQATECVAPLEYMRASHMNLLLEWRDSVVRRNVRTYEAANGKVYTISLSRTCLTECHTNKQEFCDRCHNYVGVQPNCMDCHVDPALVPRSGQ
jgi:hypothetical protein